MSLRCKVHALGSLMFASLSQHSLARPETWLYKNAIMHGAGYH
jgi:hypothetical protein